MLQRAASNAYSWWCASQIRTKQSKWLENNLQDMEEKVEAALKLLEEDGDSFAKKAEMYYKKRPEVISFVQETHKAYKGLAERYDRISGELHRANKAIATVFPDQQFGMEEDEEDSHPKKAIPKATKEEETSRLPKATPPTPPTNLTKSIKHTAPNAKMKKKEKKKANPYATTNPEKAREQIDMHQKGILVLQTEKEFVKGAYENGLAKYWNIEKKIAEMQDEVFCLQDECGEGAAVIEDDEARALMAVTALKSCEDTLVKLEEKQRQTMEEARQESERIKNAKERLMALKKEHGQLLEEEACDPSEETTEATPVDGSDLGGEMERLELQSMCEKVKKSFQTNSEVNVLDLAEKIDELASKVITLETTESSQMAQIRTLRAENDELQKHLKTLEEENANLLGDSEQQREKIDRVEKELRGIQVLDSIFRDERQKTRKSFSSVCHTFNHLSNKMQSPEKSVGEEEQVIIMQTEPERWVSFEQVPILESTEEETKNPEAEERSEEPQDLGNEEKPIPSPHGDVKVEGTGGKEEEAFCKMDIGKESKDHDEDEEASTPNWKELFMNGLGDREKVLLAEYTSILRKFKEEKRKLSDAEKKNQDCVFQTGTQLRDMRNAIVLKDEEIRSLQQKLNFMEGGSVEESKLDDGNYQKPKEAEDLQGVLSTEEKFRRKIDVLLEENLEFWIRFSSSFQQIQRYQIAVQTVQAEAAARIKEGNKKQEGSNSAQNEEDSTKSEASLLHKQLNDLRSDLSIWVEQNGLLTEELHSRFSSLDNILEEIIHVSKQEPREGDVMMFTPYQASKFQGEVMSMQQENNKVAEELQAGLIHVKSLQTDVEESLDKLDKKFALGSKEHNGIHGKQSNKSKVPLRSFLFGTKHKKQSIFACVNPAMAMHRPFSDLVHKSPRQN